MLNRWICKIVALTVIASGLAAISSSPSVAAVPPTPAVPVPVSVAMQQNSTIENTSADLDFTVGVGGSGPRKVQLVAERSPLGADSWGHASNEFPYYSQIITVGQAATSAGFTIPKRSFQGGYDYRLQARQWADGDGGNPSGWSGWLELTTSPLGQKPIAPYPTTPKGSTPPAQNILRADDSAIPGSFASPITDYEFEIRTLHDPFIAGVDDVAAWTETVPFAGSGQFTEVAVDSCQSIPGCSGLGEMDPPVGTDLSLRWRVRSKDDLGQSSEWSRWRYFDTADTQPDYWYIPNRAGSYQAGPSGGDEASGLVASEQYPGVFWFIRDSGNNEDRAKLYAIKIDPLTGRLTNLDGYITKEIAVTGAENTDWESIVADDSGNLWIGDTGDYYRKDDPGLTPAEAAGQFRDRNNTSEPDVKLFRVPEPNPYSDTTVAVTKVAPYQFPDGLTYNSEAMFWLDGWMFLLTKEVPQRLYRFPTWISSTQANNNLRLVGVLDATIDPITDASVNHDNSLLALTTSSERLVVFDGPGGTPTSSSSAEGIAESLLMGQEAQWHYYYRSAGALLNDGLLDAERPQGGPGGQWRQTGMQVEGVAFNGLDIAMISEFGKHVLYVPPTDPAEYSDWAERPGPGTSLGGGGTINDGDPPPGTLIEAGSQWRYRDSGIRPSGFHLQSYDDSGWPVGATEMGAGDGDEATVINRNQPAHVTDYFRRSFQVADASAIDTIDIDLKVDDGAIVYINGVAVARQNMPGWPVMPSEQVTAVNTVYGSAENEIHTFKISNPPLVDGENVVAVEVHQADQGSSDTTFDMSMREGSQLPPATFDLTANVDSNGLDLRFDWSEIPGASEYRLYRRDLVVQNPTWVLEATLPAGSTSTEFDTDYQSEVADYRLTSVTGGAESIPTFAQRIVFATDPNNVVSTSGYIIGNSAVDVTVVPLPEQADVNLGGLVALGGAAVVDPVPGDEVVLGFVIAGVATLAVVGIISVTSGEISFGGTTLAPPPNVTLPDALFSWESLSVDVRDALVAAGITASALTLSGDVPVYRVHGGCAGEVGRSWTPIDPRLVEAVAAGTYRDLAGLPSCNLGTYLTTGTMNASVFAQRLAVGLLANPLDGNAGGLPEIYFFTPADAAAQVANRTTIQLVPPV